MKIFRTEMNNADVFELMVAVRKEYPGWLLPKNGDITVNPLHCTAF